MRCCSRLSNFNYCKGVTGVWGLNAYGMFPCLDCRCLSCKREGKSTWNDRSSSCRRIDNRPCSRWCSPGISLLAVYFLYKYSNWACGSLGALSVLKGDYAVKGSDEPMDKAGSLLLIISLSSLIIFMTQLSRWGLISISSLFVAGVCVLTGIGFVLNEKKTKFPLFDMNLLTIKLFLFPVISSAILFAALFVIIFMMPFYLTYPCGFSASKTGGIMIVPFLFLLFFSPVAGILYDKFRSRALCMTGMSTLMISLVSLITIQPSMGVVSILWRIALAGLGTALFISPNNTAIMSCVPLQRRGTASGAVATARNLGMVIGVALAGLIFSTSFSTLTKGASLENYLAVMEPFFMISFKKTMVMGVVLSVLGLFITYARGKEE